jgi:23S rRNA (adenine2503-C2)-methyltransferase
MGMGEPLANYDEMIKAVRIMNDPQGLTIGARRMTLSTCGLIPGIQRLAAEQLQIELSVSLHGATDAVRNQIMPVNRKYPVAELIQTCRDYVAQTNRIITFEYILLRGVNDRPADAKASGSLLRGLKCKINLIPYNPVAGLPYQRPRKDEIRTFQRALTQQGIHATVRRQRGSDIDAACGQLRLKQEAGV